MKRLLLRLATAPGLRSAFGPWLRGRASIFTFHRFRSPAHSHGYDPRLLERLLELLRKERVRTVPLDELTERLAGVGAPPDGCVAFTLDDGYADQAEVAAPIFAAFDCPVTTFVATGFLDGECWMWWDRIEYAVERCARPEMRIVVGRTERTYPLDSDSERRQAIDDLIGRCKGLSESEKLATLERLGGAADLEFPDRVPDRYAPMTWDRLRSCRDGGMRFGPHTVTHPILARTSDAQSRVEIERSWRRLRKEDDRALPIFAYPNGRPGDFGPRETAVLRRAGLVAAVSGTQTYARAGVAADSEARWSIPRFGEPTDALGLLQITSGLEGLKRRLRGD